MNNDLQPKKRFKLFDLNRDGKGVKKEDVKKIKPNFLGFFKYYKLHFNKLLSVNILYVLGNFPLLFLAIALSGAFKIYFNSPLSDLSGVFTGLFSGEVAGSPLGLATFGSIGLSVENATFSTVSIVFMCLSALTVFTFGLVNVGTTFIIRNMLKGEPVFIWTDFWYAIKRNWKQGLIVGIIDVIIICLLPANILIMLGMTGGFFESMVFWMNIVIAFIYIFVRFYIYPQLVTFDLKIGKIFKNSFIFALVGWKRNILALLGIIAVLAINFILFTSGFLIPLGIAMPLVILFATAQYIGTYAAWFKIKEIMIDPYVKEEPSEIDEITPVAIDRG